MWRVPWGWYVALPLMLTGPRGALALHASAAEPPNRTAVLSSLFNQPWCSIL